MLQDQFLSALTQGRVPVTIYLMNGIRLLGELEFYDQYGLLLRGNSQQFVYKHAIATVVPSRDVPGAARHENEVESAVIPAKILRARSPRIA